MIPQACKRLAEVDFPIAEVSWHAAREKSIRHGHPSTLHLWWARRPLASYRAVLLALLLPDPCDPHCPAEFKVQARELLLAMRGRASGWEFTVKTDEGLRQVLLKFIADFANWDNSAKNEYLDTGRRLVQAAHPEETPLVVDPFAGGGSIPLEALRLGCEAFASDLNPVACLILKVMLEDIPRHGPGLADELREAGAEIKAQAEKELADLYPKDPDGATPIAYLWARTVRCEAPNCGAEIPLMRSFWLCQSAGQKWAVRSRVVREAGLLPRVEFEIFQPLTDGEVAGPTVSQARATCLCCHSVVPPSQVRSQLANQRGGADVIFDEQGNRTGGARLIAVVTLQIEHKQRGYRLSTYGDYVAVRRAQDRIERILNEWEKDGSQGPCPVPDEEISFNEIRRITVLLYGMLRWGDLFTARQKAALVEILNQIEQIDTSLVLRELLTCAVSVFVRSCNSNARLRPNSTVAPAFGRHALPITWTFPETVVSGSRTENFGGAISSVAGAIESIPSLSAGNVQQADASDQPLPDQSAGIWFTDPPYYDAIPYAHLSDFFFVWIRRSLEQILTINRMGEHENATPKEREIVVDRPHRLSTSKKDALFYETEMARAFIEGRRLLKEDGVGCVIFAHKTTEGWEALLSGIIQGGWTVTGSWPIATESASRLNARETASLETSVHLICRPRPEDAPIGEWADVLRELPDRVGDWMQRLQGEGVRGADLVFACIGPALEIYSRYSGVETAEGHKVELPDYLERVWEVVGREALEQVLGTAEAQARNGAAGALEEDARLTALFLWTLQSTEAATWLANYAASEADDTDEEGDAPRRRTSGYRLLFDVVRRFAQPLGIHLNDWESSIIETEKGVVRLRPVTERGKELFGESGADTLADEFETSTSAFAQLSLFPDEPPPVRGRARRRGRLSTSPASNLDTPLEATTLDRVHAAMLFQASGRTEALRNLLRAEQERGPDFLRLANALSALYPRGSEEKRLLDGMLLAAPR